MLKIRQPKHDGLETLNFTLIELMIVVGIVGILLALAAPAVGRARTSAIQTRCANNLRQCVNALIIYANHHDGWITAYGPNCSGWYAQTGIPQTLGFSMGEPNRKPSSYRPVSMCPAGLDETIKRLDDIAFGVPFFRLNPGDYVHDNFEKVLNANEEYIRLHSLPMASAYAIMADSAHTKYDHRGEVAPGAQCVHFSRRDEGLASPINSAICERHNGLGNVAFADGHLTTTRDKATLLKNSKLGAYVDASGQDVIFICAEDVR